jgi:hypothetical protein
MSEEPLAIRNEEEIRRSNAGVRFLHLGNRLRLMFGQSFLPEICESCGGNLHTTRNEDGLFEKNCETCGLNIKES